MPWKKSCFPLDALDISRAKHLGSFSPLFVIDWAYGLQVVFFSIKSHANFSFSNNYFLSWIISSGNTNNMVRYK